jgi:hypothetical protein
MLDAVDQLHVLQQHQVHVKQGSEFMWRLFRSHAGDALLQASDFFDYGIAPGPHPVDFRINLGRVDEIMGHIHPAGGNQHRTPNGHTP